MKVLINNFRCLSYYKINFNHQGTILLKGESGVGKSTILDAIAWCLFGKIKDVYPNYELINKKKIKVFVKIKWKDLEIKREKNSDRFRIKINDKQYEGDEAQSIIIQRFGDYETWLISSYIIQDEKNLFLSLTNNDKFNFLDKLVFDENKSREYIDKINKNIVKSENYVEFSNKLLKDQYKVINEKESLYDFSSIKNLNENDIENVLSELNNTLNEQIEYNIERNTKLNNLKSLKNKLTNLQNINIQSINIPDHLLNFTNRFKIIEPYKEQIIKNIQLKNSIDKIIENKIFTIQDYNNILEYEKNKLLIDQCCQYFSIDYNITFFENKLKELLDIESIYKKRNELNSIQLPNIIPLKENNIQLEPNKISESKNYLENLKTELINLNNELSKLNLLIQNESTCYLCPVCQSNLQIKNNQLLKYDNINFDELRNKKQELELQIFHVKKKIKDHSIEYEKLKKQHELNVKKIEQIRLDNHNIELKNEKNKYIIERKNKLELEIKEFENINGIKLIEIENNKLKYDIQYLNKILFVINRNENINRELLQYSSKEIIDTINYQNIIKFDFENQFNFNDIEFIKYFDKIKKYYHENLKIQNLINDRNQQILSVQNEIIKLEEWLTINKNTYDLSIIKNKIKYNHDIQRLFPIYHDYIKLKTKTSDLEVELNTIINKINNAYKLKDIIIETECNVLKNITSTINEYINYFCKEIFDQHMMVKLELIKKMKNHDKHNINFSFYYKNSLRKNYQSLSGGEKSRFSLAITCAIAKITNTPFIIFDEVINSINFELKKKIIDVLEKNFNVPIIIVMHDSVEGIFNHTIEIKN